MTSKKNRIKGCLVVFWLSIITILLINSIEGAISPTPTYFQQDTIVKKVTLRDVKEQKKLTEYENWQLRSKQMDKDMLKMAKQSALIDSLLAKPDTIK